MVIKKKVIILKSHVGCRNSHSATVTNPRHVTVRLNIYNFTFEPDHGQRHQLFFSFFFLFFPSKYFRKPIPVLTFGDYQRQFCIISRLKSISATVKKIKYQPTPNPTLSKNTLGASDTQSTIFVVNSSGEEVK